MPRLIITTSFGSLHSSVTLALLAAAVAMVATAGISVLTSDEVAAAHDLYSRHWPLRPVEKGGKRAVRAAVLPAPDASLVIYVPTITRLANERAEIVRPVFMVPTRPLHEAEEVPENFI